MNELEQEYTTRGGGKLVTARWLSENRFCGATPKTIRLWASAGTFPAPLVTTRKLKFWSLAEIDAWIEANALTDEEAGRLTAAGDKLRAATATGDAMAEVEAAENVSRVPMEIERGKANGGSTCSANEVQE